MKPKRKRLLWFEFRDHQRRRKPWRVYLVDALPDASVGMCYRRPREIAILASQPYKSIIKTLGHELVHAACAHVAYQTGLEHEGEEYTARKVESAMLPIIASLGGSLPPLPDGFARMRRELRRTAA